MDDLTRQGAQQPKRFDPAKAALLDDTARFAYLPPPEIVALLELPQGARLVDFGAGTGTYAVEIARVRPDVHIFALEEQPEMLALLRAKIGALSASTLEAIDPAQARPLRGTVDRIIALNVLHELGATALADLRSLLSTDGFAVFVDWNGDVERPHGPPRAHVYGVEQARARLEAGGFVVGAASRFPYHFAMKCSLGAPAEMRLSSRAK